MEYQNSCWEINWDIGFYIEPVEIFIVSIVGFILIFSYILANLSVIFILSFFLLTSLRFLYKLKKQNNITESKIYKNLMLKSIWKENA